MAEVDDAVEVEPCLFKKEAVLAMRQKIEAHLDSLPNPKLCEIQVHDVDKNFWLGETLTYNLFEYVLAKVLKERNLIISCTLMSMPPIYCLADKNEHAIRQTKHANTKKDVEKTGGLGEQELAVIATLVIFGLLYVLYW